MTTAVDSTNRFAALLRRARIDAGLTLRALAERVGTSHSTLAAYEQGRKTPSVATFARILECCDVALDMSLSRRIRRADDIERGEELRAVLELAEQFPRRVSRRMELPIFGRPR
ncbi:MAG: helix-turn-helix transcriptional regulator [Halioglobus sp.]|nr:helix-turn-helix transcriptional regulator [Halioglobus sp.]